MNNSDQTTPIVSHRRETGTPSLPADCDVTAQEGAAAPARQDAGDNRLARGGAIIVVSHGPGTARLQSLPKELRSLLSDVAHEVNSPLGTALASVQTALRLLPRNSSPRLTKCMQTTAERIQLASRAIERLTNDPDAERAN